MEKKGDGPKDHMYITRTDPAYGPEIIVGEPLSPLAVLALLILIPIVIVATCMIICALLVFMLLAAVVAILIGIASVMVKTVLRA